ncbi:MAG TPA: kelch repeat-containing protein, partial [Nitrospiria bacterium]|nr:kelch repeat-containing protein [Nitrospiria bacterium]
PLSPPPARLGHTMVYDSINERALMFGGFADRSPSPSSGTWVYDYPNWNQLSPLPSIPKGRFLHAMAYDSENQQAILFGGATQGCGVDCSDIDPDYYQADTWTYIPDQ